MLLSKNTVGERLEFVRSDRKLTQQAFCERIQISRGAFQHYVKGSRSVPSCVLERVILEFGTEARWLVTGHAPLLSGDDEQLVRDCMMLRTLVDQCLNQNDWKLTDDQKIRIIQNIIIVRSKSTDNSVYDREKLKALVRREAVG